VILPRGRETLRRIPARLRRTAGLKAQPAPIAVVQTVLAKTWLETEQVLTNSTRPRRPIAWPPHEPEAAPNSNTGLPSTTPKPSGDRIGLLLASTTTLAGPLPVEELRAPNDSEIASRETYRTEQGVQLEDPFVTAPYQVASQSNRCR